MYNLCKFGTYVLESSKTTLSCSSSVRCNSKKIYKDLESTNSQNNNQRSKEKNIKHKRCSQSEPRSHHINQDNPRDTSLILAALNTIEILDSRCKSPSRRRRQSILESVNSVSKKPQISNIPTQNNQNQISKSPRVPEENQNYNENPSESNSKQFGFSGRAQNEPDNNERQYIINVFLNDKSKETKEDCVDIHINNIDVSSDEVCMHKLTENIHKSYKEIDQILNDNLDFDENRPELTKELKRVWSDVFKQSKVEDFELLEQRDLIEDHDVSKDDTEDILEESNLKKQSVITVDEELDRKDIENDLERKSDEGLIVNPIITAAELDEVIKKNTWYKKTRTKRNARLLLEKQKQTEPIVEIKKATIDSKQMKNMVEPMETKPDPIIAENVKLKTQYIVKDPVVITSALIKEKVTQNQNKEVNVETNLVKETPTTSKESFQNTVIKSQEAFDPVSTSDEFEISMLEKTLVEEQINKCKNNVAKEESSLVKEPAPKSRKFVKPRKREIIDVLPQDDNVPPSVTRPVPLTLGKRLKYYNERTQKQIQDIINMSALPPESQKTIKRVVTFCKDLLRDNQLRSRLPKVLQNDDFVDRKIGSKTVFSPENSTMNMQYSSFIQTKPKIDDQPSSNEEKLDQSCEIGSMVSNEEIMGSQQSFQQKCGVRERIMPKPMQQSNYYKIGQRRLSYSRRILGNSKLWGKKLSTNSLNRVIWKRFYCSESDKTKDDKTEPKDKTETKDDKMKPKDMMEAKDDKTEPKDDNIDPNDPCAEIEKKAGLKPCQSHSCKEQEERRVNKCESPQLIKQISEGVLGCTSKCLVNRFPNEPAEPDPQQVPCQITSDPRYKQQVPAEEPKCDIMDQICKYVSNEKDFEQVECYYGDNGYKNLEYFKYFRTSFYDINAYLSKERNPQPDANSHKARKTEKKDSCNL